MSITAVLLNIIFAIAWSIASLDRERGLIVLCCASSLMTLPYFLGVFGRGYLGTAIISLLLLGIAVVFPLLWPLVVLWGAICLAGKFAALLQNVPFVLAGVGLYVLSFFVPHMMFEAASTLMGSTSALPLQILVGVMGGLFFLLLHRLTRAAGWDALNASAVALGFTAYFALFLFTFLLPGFSKGGGDSGHSA